MITFAIIFSIICVAGVLLLWYYNPVVDKKTNPNLLWYGPWNNRKYVKLK